MCAASRAGSPSGYVLTTSRRPTAAAALDAWSIVEPANLSSLDPTELGPRHAGGPADRVLADARLPALDQQFPAEFRPNALSGATPAELVAFSHRHGCRIAQTAHPRLYCSCGEHYGEWFLGLLAISERFGGCGAILLALGEQKREGGRPGPLQRSLGEQPIRK